MRARHPVVLAGVLLALFGMLGSALVALTYDQTAERIAQNEREALLRSLNALVPPDARNNDMIADRFRVHRKELLGTDATTVYRARQDGAPVAAVFTTVAPDGYAGPIKLLVAVRWDGSLAGVRVVAHKETPGLGDRIEEKRSDWVHGFAGRSLGDPPLQRWRVKRDGGVFDQFTGATITPRAIVRAVKNTLIYFKEKRDWLFEQPAEALEAS
jgi:electron transport complex protein RnfG